MKPHQRPMWHCPECGAPFVNPNQSHSCVKLELESHFVGKPPHLRDLFDQFLQMVEEHGKVTVIPQKTRIIFMDRVRFTGAWPKSDYLHVHFVMLQPSESPRFARIELVPPEFYVHSLKVRLVEELDDEVRVWIAEAWKYGRQDRFK